MEETKALPMKPPMHASTKSTQCLPASIHLKAIVGPAVLASLSILLLAHLSLWPLQLGSYINGGRGKKEHTLCFLNLTNGFIMHPHQFGLVAGKILA